VLGLKTAKLHYDGAISQVLATGAKQPKGKKDVSGNFE